MKLPFLFNKIKAKRKQNFLTLDVGTDYVKCLLFEVLPSSPSAPVALPKLQVVGYGKQPLGYLYTRSGAIVDFDGVKQAASMAISQACAGRKNVRDVIIGLSGEMSKGLVTTVRLTRADEAEKITQKELSEITARIEESAFLEASKEVAAMTGNPDLEIDLVNSAIAATRLDGLYVEDVLGLTGKKMEIALFTAFSPSFHMKIIQKLAVSLRLNILTIASDMYSLNKSLSNSKADLNAIIMDIGGETTDVGIVFGSSLVATRTLSIGGRHITRAISETFGLSFVDAEEKKLRYALGTLYDFESQRIAECIKDVLELWLSGIEVLFSDFDGVKTFPSKILLVGGGSHLKDLLSLIEREPWTKNIPFKEPPTFERIKFSDIRDITDMTGKIQGQDDVVPAALSRVYLEMKGFSEN